MSEQFTIPFTFYVRDEDVTGLKKHALAVGKRRNSRGLTTESALAIVVRYDPAWLMTNLSWSEDFSRG